MTTNFAGIRKGSPYWSSSFTKREGPRVKIKRRGETKRVRNARNKKIAKGNKSHGHGRK